MINDRCGEESSAQEGLLNALKHSSIPDNEVLSNLGLFMPRQLLARILFINHLYQNILTVHGSIFEFGVRWGQNMSLFSNLRSIYEPFNYNRAVVGFDTFSGFPSVAEEDGGRWKENDYSVTKNYGGYLEKIIQDHEKNAPLSHKKKCEIIKGDAIEEIHSYLDENPHTIVALAYFDFDLYQPTKECLLAIKDRMPKGSVIAFDELNCKEFPGETKALLDVFGVHNVALQRVPFVPLCSYFIVT